MLAFEIYKNGRKMALAGLEDSGAVSLMLTWIGKGPGASRKAAQGFAIEGLDLRVGGIDTSDPAGEQSIEWIDEAAFALGTSFTSVSSPPTRSTRPCAANPRRPSCRGNGRSEIRPLPDLRLGPPPLRRRSAGLRVRGGRRMHGSAQLRVAWRRARTFGRGPTDAWSNAAVDFPPRTARCEQFAADMQEQTTTTFCEIVISRCTGRRPIRGQLLWIA